MAIYPSDNCLVLSWTSYCNFLLHDKPAPMNNLLQLATQCSSEFFINSGGFSKFNNKPGAKNLIALKVSGFSVLIAVGIMIWPCRAKFSWTKILHRCEAKTMYLCPNKERSFTFLVLKAIMLVFVWFCANFILYRYFKYFYCVKKVFWMSLHCLHGRFRMCSVWQHYIKAPMMWVSHQNYRSSSRGNLQWKSSWHFSRKDSNNCQFARPWLTGWSVLLRSVPSF